MARGFITANNPDLQTILPEIHRYWGESLEIVFPIHPNLLMRLMNKSETNEVLFQVTHLRDPDRVTAAWKPFDNQLVESTRNFILPATLIDNLVRPYASLGIDNHDMLICARICLIDENKYGVFFHRFVGGYQSGGTGGDTMSAGAKIPSHR
jgi:hypothetical protein